MNNTNAAQTYRLVYATEDCTRCGGSGRYSRCELHGEDCFKCVVVGNPAGLQSTKAAVAARKAVAAFRDALLTVDASALKIGDQINTTSTRSGTARHGKARQLTIKEIGPAHVAGVGAAGSKACAWSAANSHLSLAEKAAIIDANPGMCDETIDGKTSGLTVSRVFTVTGEKTSVDVSVGSTLQRMPTADDIEKIVAFARTLDGVTVVPVQK